MALCPRLDEQWLWEVNEEMNKMWEMCWQVPNAFEQGSLNLPGQLAPDFEVLGLLEAMSSARSYRTLGSFVIGQQETNTGPFLPKNNQRHVSTTSAWIGCLFWSK